MRNLWRYQDRRWSDERPCRFDRVRRACLAAWPLVASLAAMAVVAAAVVTIVAVADQRDDVLATARAATATAADAARAARDAEETSEQVRVIAAENRSISQSIQAFLAAQAPCDPTSPPESPACQRAVRTQAAIDDALDRINEALGKTLASHDSNVHQALARLVELLRAGEPLPAPAPIAVAPVPPAAVVGRQDPAAPPASPAAAPPVPPMTVAVDPICRGQGRGQGRCR